MVGVIGPAGLSGIEGIRMSEQMPRRPLSSGLRFAALALVVGLLGGSLWLGNPFGRSALAEHDPDRIACSRVYDTVACSCAAAASVRDEQAIDVATDEHPNGQTSAWRPTDGRVAVGSNPQPVVRRVGVGRVPMNADFVRRVQACMAGGASVPID
jgi:hypothetical protein